jgi:hypothetical protein
MKVVFGLTEEEFDLSLEDGQVIVDSGQTRSGIMTFDGPLFEIIDEMLGAKEKWSGLPDDFNQAVFLCMFSVAKDVSRGVMAHLSISGDRVVSSDDLRISEYKIKSSLKKSFLLPLSSVIELAKLSMTGFVLKDNWVHFNNKEGMVFSSCVLLDDFMQYEDFLKVEGNHLQLPEGLKALVVGVTVFAEGEFDLDKKVSVVVDKNKIICKGEKESGWIEKRMDFPYKGKKLEFLVNPLFFSQVLDKSTEVIIGEGVAMFRSGPFRHVMSLPIK